MGGESRMTHADWMKRAGEQARAMYACLDAFDSSPDSEGIPTGGCYNGDYSDAYHDRLNAQLAEDEYYEAEVELALRTLHGQSLNKGKAHGNNP